MSPNEIKILKLRETAWKGLIPRLPTEEEIAGIDKLIEIVGYVETMEHRIDEALDKISWTVFVFPSKSGGNEHTVRTDGQGYVLCSCAAAKFGKECWAMRQVKAKEEYGRIIHKKGASDGRQRKTRTSKKDKDK